MSQIQFSKPTLPYNKDPEDDNDEFEKIGHESSGADSCGKRL